MSFTENNITQPLIPATSAYGQTVRAGISDYKLMEAGEGAKLPQWVEPDFSGVAQPFVSPLEQRIALEREAIPHLDLLRTKYREACDHVEAFQANQEQFMVTAQHQFIHSFAHPAIKLHFAPGNFYLNHGIENKTFTGQKDEYRILSIAPNLNPIRVVTIEKKYKALTDLLDTEPAKTHAFAKYGRNCSPCTHNVTVQRLHWKPTARALNSSLPTFLNFPTC